MAEQRRVYRVTGAQSVSDLQEQINFLMAQIAERLDQMEGYRGTPTFRSNVDMTGKKIQGLAIGTTSGEAMTADLDTDPGLSISSTKGLSVQTDASRAIDRDAGGVFARIDDESLELEVDPRDRKKKRIKAKLKAEGGIEVDHTPTTGGMYVNPSQLDHGALDGLGDDDHPQYALLNGRTGGQVLYGGTGSGDDITLSSTTNATKGNINIGANATFDEVNNRLGVGTLSPGTKVDAVDDGSTNTFQATAYVNSTAGTGLRVNRSRGTLAAPRRIKSGDATGIYNAKGTYAADDATDAVIATYAQGQFKFVAAEDYTSTNQGTDFIMALCNKGATSPTNKFIVKANGGINLPETTSDPTTSDIADMAAFQIYMKNNKLVFAFNNAGTITYLTIPLDGATTTWTQSTVAP